MGETLHFYHINDLHSYFDHWPRIEKFIGERKAIHKEVGEESIIFDLGDHADRFHPYTEGTLGQGNIKLLNELGCQYATIGNNEGITFPYEVLNHFYDKADFEVIITNLYDRNGNRPSWTKPYKIHTTQKGTSIAIIGATAYFRLFYESLGWRITEPIEEIKKAVLEVKEQSDIIVLLSHLGIDYDERIAEEIPDIHLILGAHTHHILHEGKQVNNTLLCGAGKAGRYVGHVELSTDDNNKLQSIVARVNDMNKEDPSDNEQDFKENLYAEGEELLAETVCEITESYPVEWFKESKLTQLLCDELREHCSADCAFLNAGLLLDGLNVGIVKKYDLHRICPHPINPCVVELTGQELKEIIVQSMEQEWPHMQVKGFGFRGHVLGVMVYSNITIKSPYEMYVGDEKLNLKKIYRLAIPDMFTFGYFFPEIKRSEKKKYYLPEFMRDLLETRLSKLSN